MRNILPLLLVLLAGLVSCRATTNDKAVVETAEVAQPELRYYIIGDR